MLSAGITVDKYGLIFFVDGTMIRRIDQNGIISTLLGFNDLTSARPLSCDAVMDISQVWPFCPLACDLLSTYPTLSDRPESVGHLEFPILSQMGKPRSSISWKSQPINAVYAQT